MSSHTTDPHDLERFVAAQDGGGTYERALSELRAGRKTTHWMWFIFPQISGLGSSGMARRYAIGSLDEARAYLGHPVLGRRLRACVEAICALGTSDAEAVFGGIDAMKLRSSLTLFLRAARGEAEHAALFARGLDKFFGGRADAATDAKLAETR